MATAVAAVAQTSSALAQTATVVDRPAVDQQNVNYAGNRTPLKPASLVKLPANAFIPDGWLGKKLEQQRDGLTGNLGEISIWLTKKDNAWLNGKSGKGEYGWEEVPYWLRGYARVGYALNDPKMLAETKTWIEGTLASQRDNGDFGPMVNRGKHRDLWAQMIMLQVLQGWHEYSGDARVVPFMSKFFQWVATIPDEQFLRDYWENSRGGDMLASVYWLYNLTGEPSLLELGTKIDRNTANWRQADNLPNWHVVNIAECFRAPATYYLQSGKQEDLLASYNNQRLARERYGQVPGGMFGADENARPGHTDPHQASETCSFVEQLWSNGIMLGITADPMWAENAEDVAFNMMPAAFMPDYRALRYLTAPNMVLSDSKNHAPGIANEGPFLMMNPFSSRCCQHNHTSGWINYAEHAWMATPDNGLAAVLYAPGRLTAKAGEKDNAVKLSTQTRYPFEDTVTISIDEGGGTFPIYLRIPSWCEAASVSINGKPVDVAAKAGGYVKVSNEWKAGDKLALKLPMNLRLRTWTKNKDSVSVDYGPLTFSLKIDERFEQKSSTETAIGDSGWQPGADVNKWPSFEIHPNSDWNYALAIAGDADATKRFEIVTKPWPTDNDPFTNAATPIELRAPGRQLPDWTLDKHGLAGALPQSPVATDAPTTTLTLVPMGGARLRISAFPTTAK